jgi:hypothetical protein
MSEHSDVVSAPFDKHRCALPRESQRRATGGPVGMPALWAATEVLHTPDRPMNHPGNSRRVRDGRAPGQAMLWQSQSVFDSNGVAPEPCHGRYPRGFLSWALQDLALSGPEVLHVCSGAMTPDEALGGLRVDLRRSQAPDVIADGRNLPFANGSIAAVFIDPPYTVEYAEGLYGTEYPRPSHLLAEASRVVRPGGVVALLHYLVCIPPPNCTFERVVGVTQGMGYRIRAWTIYRKGCAELPFEREP